MSSPFEEIERLRQERLKQLAAEGVAERDAPFQETPTVPEVMTPEPPRGDGIPEVIDPTPPSINPPPNPLFGANLAPEKSAAQRIAESEAALAEQSRIEAENLAEQNELARLESLRIIQEAQRKRVEGATKPARTQDSSPVFGPEPAPQTTSFTTPTGQPQPGEFEGTLTGQLLEAGVIAGEKFEDIRKGPQTPGDILGGILEGAKAEVFPAAAGVVAVAESLGEFVGGRDVPDIGGAIVGSAAKSFEGTVIDVSKPSGLGIDVKFTPTATREAEFLSQNPLFLAGAVLGELAFGAILGAAVGKVVRPLKGPIKSVTSKIGITPTEEAALRDLGTSRPKITRKIDDLFRDKPTLGSGVIPKEELPTVKFTDIFGGGSKKVGAPEDFTKTLKTLPREPDIFRVTFGKTPKGTTVKTGRGTVALTKQVTKTVQKQAAKQTQKQFDAIFGGATKLATKQVTKQKQKQVQTFESIFDVSTTPLVIQKKKLGGKQKQDIIVVTDQITKQDDVLKELTGGPKQVTKPVTKQKQKIDLIQIQKTGGGQILKEIVRQKTKQELKQEQKIGGGLIIKEKTGTKQKQRLDLITKTGGGQIIKEITIPKTKQKPVPILKIGGGFKEVTIQKQKIKQEPLLGLGGGLKEVTIQKQKQMFKFSPLLSTKQVSRKIGLAPPRKQEKKKKRKLVSQRGGRKRFVNPLATFNEVLGVGRGRKKVRRQKSVPQFKF